MRNPWLAIDTSTSPAQRAREVRAAWERFQEEGRGDDARGPIAESWKRSSAAGVDPSARGSAPSVADDDEAAARWEVHPLVSVAPLIRECLAGIADDAAHLMVISDADGMLLWLEGAPSVRLAAANSMNFSIGALWSEGGAGTNAIGTALAADHAVQVFAAEHFNEVVQQWTCAAAPVHDPDTGAVLGIIDLTSQDEHRAPALVRGRGGDGGRGRGRAALPHARAVGPAARPLRRPGDDGRRHPRARHRARGA